MSKNKKTRFVVWMPCKTYVKSYLLHNYNSPDEDWPEIVNIANNQVLHDQFLIRLKKQSYRRDKTLKCSQYKSSVPVEITKDEFYRYGWSLTDTDLIKFNKMLEANVKTILHTYICMMRMTGMNMTDCINRFRDKTHINEIDWDTDSIRKEIQRNLDAPDQTLIDDFLNKIEQKVWGVLSNNGTITEQGRRYYEGDYI